jgi:hypothetical protein
MESGGESSELFKPGDICILTRRYIDLAEGEPIIITASPFRTYPHPWGRALIYAGEYNCTGYNIPCEILQKVVDAPNS